MSVEIITGDCRDVLKTLEPESYDCILTDPPYGETNLKWDKWPPGWPSLVRPMLKPSGSMWVFGSMRMFLEHTGEFQQAGLCVAQDIIWEKHNGSGFHADRFKRVHEMAVQFYRVDAPWEGVYKAPQYTSDATARTIRKKARPAHWTGAAGATVYQSEDGGPRLMRSVIFARSEHGRAEHPTQKPLSVVEPLLLYSCPIGGRVLDCFAGSGTIGLAAARHSIDATLIEGDAGFADVARRRLENDAPLLAERQ